MHSLALPLSASHESTQVHVCAVKPQMHICTLFAPWHYHYDKLSHTACALFLIGSGTAAHLQCSLQVKGLAAWGTCLFVNARALKTEEKIINFIIITIINIINITH